MCYCHSVLVVYRACINRNKIKILIEIHCKDHSCTLFNNNGVMEVIVICLFSLKEGFKPYTQCHKFKCLCITVYNYNDYIKLLHKKLLT